MNRARKLSLQLTPLLDLLLIVIFAQYLEVRDQQTVQAADAQAAIAERDRALQQVSRLQDQIQSVQQNATAATDELKTQATRRAEAEENLDRALNQNRTLGELVTELFAIPEQVIDPLLDPAERGVPNPGSLDLQRLRQRFQDLAQAHAPEMVEHLLSYDEIRKRVDVWKLHVDAQGFVDVTTGAASKRFRLPTNASGDVDQEALIAELYDWYRALPQPKGLVVVLLTYDRASRIFVTQAVRKVLPEWISRMQSDHAGRIRFEYADLGFRLL